MTADHHLFDARVAELEAEIAGGETPFDVLAMLAYAIAVWLGIIVAYWPWGIG